MATRNLAIVLTIYDGYEDLWDDCVKFINRFWNDHPQIYVFTNEIQKNWDDVICIPVGKEAEWSAKAQKAVETVREDYFILLLEDFYIGKDVDSAKVEALFQFMKENNVSYCKLCENNEVWHKKKKKYKSGLPYEVIYGDEEYGISLQASIWKKDYFANLVGQGNYNAWVFELNELKKAKGRKHEVMVDAIDDPRNIINIYHGALQGKMLPGTVEYFQSIGMGLSTKRQVMSKNEYRRYWIKQLGRDIVPENSKRFVKAIAEKFGYSFVDKKWS